MDCEHWISQVGSTPFGSAAILWHMIYAPVVGQAHGTKDLFLLNMENVAKDEIGGYRQLFHWLGRPMPQKLERLVAKRQTAESRAQPRLGQVHDFNRTAASANSYWAQVLSAEEAELVTRINGNLWERLCVFGEGLPKEMVPRVDSLH